MIALKLYRADVRAMLWFLRFRLNVIQVVPPTMQTVSMLVLRQYFASWKAQRLHRWQEHRPDRAYLLRLPLPVARALHLELQAVELDDHEYALLAKLDLALVNYRDPYARYDIGDLMVIASL